jgi:hypothetical protein
MRRVILGLVIVMGLVIVAVGAGPERAEPPQRSSWSQFQSSLANADMIALSADVGGKYQQVTLIDPKQRVMSVYHIDYASGAVALKGVRNFHYDQQLNQYNCKDPLPEDLKSLVHPR